ncbi:MAG: hypothetical protein QXK88_00725 [Desulfurococcaceae archaeon]
MVIFRRTKKKSPEEMRNELIKLIDESREAVYKEAFYSHPSVRGIVESINKRWEAAGYTGKPIDYATVDEVKALYKIAKKIAQLEPSELEEEYF